MNFVDSKRNKFYKIGISNDYNKRKQTLQKDIDFELKIVHTQFIKNTLQVEYNLKKKYNNKNIKHYYLGKIKPTKKHLPNYTEWFTLNNNDIKEIKIELNKHKIVEKEIEEEEETEILEPKTVSTYQYKKYIKGKLHYKISGKQYIYLKKNLKNKLNYIELKFIEKVCKKFNSDKFLTYKQYNFLVSIVHKYNKI
jgi:hypothetical protein